MVARNCSRRRSRVRTQLRCSLKSVRPRHQSASSVWKPERSYDRKLWMKAWKRRRTLGVLLTHPTAHEALEYATMYDATTNADALPLHPQKDGLTDVLRRGATQLLAQAIQAEVAA